MADILDQLRHSVKAKEDTNDIWRYIAQDNPKAADAFLDAIEEASELLLREEENVIEIVRIIRGARDIPSLFGQTAAGSGEERKAA